MLSDLISFITSLSQQGIELIKEAAGGDSMVSASLLLVVTALLSGLFYFLTKQLPGIVWGFIMRHFTTVLSVEYGDYDQRAVYMEIVDLIKEKSSDNSIRAFSVTSHWDSKSGHTHNKLGAGIGRHIVRYHGRFIFADVVKVESPGSDVEKKVCSLRVLGRSRSVFEQLLNEINRVDPVTDRVNIFRCTKEGWKLEDKIVAPSLDELALNPETRDSINKIVNDFLSGRETYKRLGIAYKTTCILYGKPGTGKTSMIRSIAKTFNRNVCIVDPTASGLVTAFSNLPPNPLVVLEDFDSISSVKKRTNVTKAAEEEEDWNLYSMSAILNTLDGIVSLDDVMVFLTTNTIDQIDDAMLRKGRTDHLIDLPVLESKTVKEHFESLYPELKTKDVVYPELLGCDLYDIKKNALDDHNKVIEELEKINHG